MGPSYSGFAAAVLSIIATLAFARPSLAGPARLHGMSHRWADRIHAKRDAAQGTINLPLSAIQQLQMEYAAFHSWADAWFSTPEQQVTPNDIAQLKVDFRAYDQWISAWFASVTATSGVSAVSPMPVPFPPMSKVASQTATQAGPSSTQSLSMVGSPQGPGASGLVTTTSQPGSDPSSGEATASTSVPADASDFTSDTSSRQGSFNAAAKNNLVVYYAQTAATGQVSLSQVCAQSSVNVVVLAFITTIAGPGGYPSVDFSGACNTPPTSQMTAKGASGLKSCPDLAKQITTCQAAGKKILLSMGGSIPGGANSAFTSDAQATNFATQLWNLFGAGTGEDAGLRPFGRNVKLDGFDIDNENHGTAHYTTFTKALRKKMSSDTSKRYYISAAPQCPIPDASIPLDAMQVMDFVYVQFYNNGPCNLGQAGFMDSFNAWSKQLAAGPNGGPKLFVGTAACENCAGYGSYLPPAAMAPAVHKAVAANLKNMGGVMLWDGAEGVLNTAGGKNYLQDVKSALNS